MRRLRVLDEAAASDPENELELQRAIAELTQSKTVIMIAHRLKTVLTPTIYWCLTADIVQREGTHESLMAEGSLSLTLSIYARRPSAGRLPQRIGFRLNDACKMACLQASV